MYYRTVYIELWSIIVQILTKYMTNCEAINENEYNFKTVKLVLSLPLRYTCLENLEQVHIILYKHFYILPHGFILLNSFFFFIDNFADTKSSEGMESFIQTIRVTIRFNKCSEIK